MTQILGMLMQMEKRNGIKKKEQNWIVGNIQGTFLIPPKSLCTSNQLEQLNTEA